MKEESDGTRLRIFVGELDQHEGKPLYEQIVLRARARGLAGATVFQGVMGFGGRSEVHTAKILRLNKDLPLVIELVDQSSKIEGFLKEVDGLINDGMLTLEPVRIRRYRSNA